LSLKLNFQHKKVIGSVIITGSKSESNRLLILQQLFANLSLKNVSNSEDTLVLKKGLNSNELKIDIGHAGTAMRFLTAYVASLPTKKIVLTGSERMQQRPIKVLVDALISLGADIDYLHKEGYPPLKINGKKLTNKYVKINGNVSSQYITALLLIAPSLENGLTIELIGEITSVPYIKMTLQLLSQIGVMNSWNKNLIRVSPKKEIKTQTIIVESDWSSASYYYSLVALSKDGKLMLSHFKKDSLQGDAVLVAIYKKLGVSTNFKNDGIQLIRNSKLDLPNSIELDLKNSPDLAQTIAVTCFGLGIKCTLTGLHTLKIKETDRLVALKNELEKLGAQIEITNDSLALKGGATINSNVSINTYKDHRMAMSFAPLAIKAPITIEDEKVVSKSYPDFWSDLEKVLV